MSSKDTSEEMQEGQLFGILKNGSRFPVPNTMSVMKTLLSPKSWESPATLIWIAAWVAVGLTTVLYFKGYLPLWFFCVQFAFWRLAYNIGIGMMLHYQSNGGHFLAFYKSAMAKYPRLRSFLEASVVFADNSEYKSTAFPDEFNAWMLFRQIENVILANDLMSYAVLSVVCWEKMTFSIVDTACFLIGSLSIVFALWSKSDAHRVIGDFAWYWGDFFFLLDVNLTFDGIFQMFPHPMYTVGYAFMYGVPLMAKSYTLFYMSVFGHLCQLAFLAFVENPHIDRTYMQMVQPEEEELRRKEVLYGNQDKEAYLDPDELVVFLHFNTFRASDLLLALVVLYQCATLLFPIPAWAYVFHCVLWRAFHSCFLGYILRRQSDDKWFSRHYDSPQRAFNNWKRIYNASVTLTNLSYVYCAIKLFQWSVPFFEGNETRIFLIVVGILLIGVNAYVSLSIYNSLGDYGYFYGDFFIDDVVPSLDYSGVYRYLNNPDTSLGLSAFYGIALISGSGIVLVLAIVSHLSIKLFEVLVEKPHMRKLHGAQLRQMGGLQTEVRRRVNESKAEYEKKLDNLKGMMGEKKVVYDKIKEKIANTVCKEKEA
ncbi:phosphatidylethanolamine N-methyltransferase [Strigomonas culicis]|uniref:Phosphatidylethanolamine N-methyltransferase n=1 Tax=Strigomonas culicis TaxID=28005 RepID=S9VX68_9TRYP|nr:phosphatidylethanolamine N-methyltransferase [Strigomonas culicis]EPY30142.1 phosphatidylethanolaminen-methyltransferase-lik E protein [Strigomonas culicis]EPY30834.1 phosphatidylethanolamine N-methyltransferase [Strigomonas culicis]|eukprot:EPY28190.1 phosphatidylethanolamine N-methyltransferase [Strigomonas culicis]